MEAHITLAIGCRVIFEVGRVFRIHYLRSRDPPLYEMELRNTICDVMQWQAFSVTQ